MTWVARRSRLDSCSPWHRRCHAVAAVTHILRHCHHLRHWSQSFRQGEEREERRWRKVLQRRGGLGRSATVALLNRGITWGFRDLIVKGHARFTLMFYLVKKKAITQRKADRSVLRCLRRRKKYLGKTKMYDRSSSAYPRCSSLSLQSYMMGESMRLSVVRVGALSVPLKTISIAGCLLCLLSATFCFVGVWRRALSILLVDNAEFSRDVKKKNGITYLTLFVISLCRVRAACFFHRPLRKATFCSGLRINLEGRNIHMLLDCLCNSLLSAHLL